MRKKKRRRKKWFIPKHRRPPMPACFKNEPQWGTCRWCNKTIYKDDGAKNKRRKWHPECLHEFKIVTDFKYAKRQVKKRDKGICKDCGILCRLRSEWQLDHEKPLIDAAGDISFWMLKNLSTRCLRCHSKKTLKENKERGKGWFKRG